MIDIREYTYDLPEDRIAQFPLEKRDESRLLTYRENKIEHHRFYELPDLLPGDAFLFFNDTKVIPARIIFQKETGADIEVFLLSPVKPSTITSITMSSKGSCSWKCTIGNLKRWKSGLALTKAVGDITLSASLVDRENGVVEFTWPGEKTFAEVIMGIGQVPLPPYLKRKADDADKVRYQTVYSHFEGAVAAPTAGLHFTNKTFQALKNRNIGIDFLTLHVSAGTFQPVKVQNAEEHTMHVEQIVVSRSNLENILRQKKIIAVGTTSMRTLESIFWYGVNLEQGNTEFRIGQNDPYKTYQALPPVEQAIERILKLMDEKSLETITGKTSIFLKPGYKFRVCSGLITNFHQPGSTLILLVAAFVGEDWKKIYTEALKNDYRFLSYGDSSLLMP